MAVAAAQGKQGLSQAQLTAPPTSTLTSMADAKPTDLQLQICLMSAEGMEHAAHTAWKTARVQTE